MRWRTNWWVSARDTPSAAKVKLTCSTGLACPDSITEATNWACFSRAISPDSRRGHMSATNPE